MLDTDGRVLITDFGLARTVEARSRTVTRRFVGTLHYAAPESLLPASKKGPDARMDVYGVGATLYEALSLRRPFAEYGGDEGALLQAVQTKDPPPLKKIAPWVPRELAIITAKAMEKDRDARYSTAADLADDLTRYLDGKPIMARPAGPIVRTRKWAGRHPGKAVAIAAVVVILVISTGILVGQRLARERAGKKHLASAEALLAQDDFDEARKALVLAQELLPDSLEACEFGIRLEAAKREAERNASRKVAFDAAEAARREADGRISEYERLKAKMARLKTKISEDRYACFSRYASVEKRAALARLENEYERLNVMAERLIQEAREALERAARREEVYDGPHQETSDAYARYYVDRWREAIAALDDVRKEVAAAAVRKYDREGKYKNTLLGRGVLTVTVDPIDAEICLFRYLSYEMVRPDPPVVPRLVPVPTRGVGLVRTGAWAKDFFPGDICLVVTGVETGSIAEKAGLCPGDLVIRLNGHPCGDGLFVKRLLPKGQAAGAGISVLARIRSVDGERVEGSYEWRNPRCKKGRHKHRLTVAGTVIEEDCSSHRSGRLERTFWIRPALPAELINGRAPAAMRLRCLHNGTPLTIEVPEGESSGIQCERTAYPLILSAERRVTAGQAITMDPGPYLLYVQRRGFEAQRYSVRISHGERETVKIHLNKEGTTPPGFVYIPPGAFVCGGSVHGVYSKPRKEVVLPGFFIARKEVTIREWFKFLNDPETLNRIREGKIGRNDYLPRDWRERFAFRSNIDLRCKPTVGSEETPIFGISWEDVAAFLDWRNRITEAAEEPWEYDLPTEEQWEKAARGSDVRFFPWGDRFDFSLAVTPYRKFQRGNLLGEEPGGFEPRDESAFGILDLGGSRGEWTRSKYEGASGFYVQRGGAWDSQKESLYHSANRIFTRSTTVHPGLGFRLVVRPRK